MSSSSFDQDSLARLCAVPPRADNPVCKVSGLASIRLSRPDLQRAVAFFSDFGLTCIHNDGNLALLRGTGDQTAGVVIERGPARYLGFSLTVDDAADLDKLAAAHGVAVTDNLPQRGGRLVALRDPDNLLVEVMHGWTPLPELMHGEAVPVNRPGHTPRINRTVRLDFEHPPRIHKLGHTVMGVTSFAASLAWYQQNFGLIVSDFQMLDDDPVPVVAFIRCDRGDTPSDHHTIAMGSAVEIGHLHTAFELPDLDAVVAAGELLKQRRHHHTWGIGRHILGSQIFDYWRDAEGDMFEHYADGDLFDASVPTGYHRFDGEALHQWGPAVTADMAGKTPSLHLLQTVISRLRDRAGDDLSLRRLIHLVRAAG
ncbi:glyoxalase/bleomycin resistance protein/dioxygenase superfamily protein [Fluviicoccus keumensis]|uniref:Glyoxalase/bleomycin resistance protein/dioxygenase superfamily protein n=1 Tax=Fluviicoccus keumensis TaxID=1435465 RepID=A0A4Q7YP15_9GAMM|nr:VOC family protein [Fluviicoccus keumensis]RZU38591.1 glyoxalase/bleomycin resistance protein/dioxygenase superfamily protein [Fluviicoccus keumensis]